MKRQHILEAVQSKELQSEAVKDCAESVKEDNPDMDKSTAFAICQAQENKGNLSALSFDAELEEDPCWEGYEAVGMKPDPNGEGKVPNCVPEDQVENAANELAEGCPDNQVNINGECVKVEQAGTPPGLLASEPHAMNLTLEDFDVGPIERTEMGESEVRYSNIKLISPGMWTDSGSEETVWYSPEGIRNLEITDNARVNIMHDLGPDGEPNDPSDVGRIDPASVSTDESGNLFADIVLETDTAGGEYADENLQSALESGGSVGIGGPSVEIPAEGQEVEMNNQKGVPELKKGLIDGAGLVWQPAAKSVDFSRETASRAVAMSDNEQNHMYLEEARTHMDIDEIRETLDNFGMTGLDEMSDEDVMDMAEDLHDDLMDQMESDEEEGEEMGDYEDDEEEEEEETEMAGDAMEGLQEQIDDIWGKIDELEEAMMGEEMAEATNELEEELEDTKEELSDANETVAELKEAKNDLEKRLSSLEDEPKEPRTMADSDDEEEWYDADDGVSYDSATGSTHF